MPPRSFCPFDSFFVASFFFLRPQACYIKHGPYVFISPIRLVLLEKKEKNVNILVGLLNKPTSRNRTCRRTCNCPISDVFSFLSLKRSNSVDVRETIASIASEPRIYRLYAKYDIGNSCDSINDPTV